jgi:hypothetical protein
MGVVRGSIPRESRSFLSHYVNGVLLYPEPAFVFLFPKKNRFRRLSPPYLECTFGTTTGIEVIDITT